MDITKEEIKELIESGNFEKAMNRCIGKLKPYNYKDLHLPKMFNLDELKEKMKQQPDEELINGWIYNSEIDIKRLEERIEILKMFICLYNKSLEDVVIYLNFYNRQIMDKRHEIREFYSFIDKK